MATIPVNPERRDPGYLRKKADLGLSNVDNISATDLINMVADDVKIIGNTKITTNKLSAEGKEYYIGILQTSMSGLSAHANFSTGLFKSSDLNTELAQFNVDFSYSTENAHSTGSLGYTIQLPSSDPYLSNLELVFTQVGSILYITLHSSSLPKSKETNYFNQVGTNLHEWTEGVTLIDAAENYYDTIKGGIELARVKLISSRTTIQSEYCESLPVYDKETGSRVLIEPRSYSYKELEKLDYPTINNVPFLARKDLKINNRSSNNGRNITINAKHAGSTKELAGGHSWDVLDSYQVSNYIPNIKSLTTKSGVRYSPTTMRIPSSDSTASSKFGLCRIVDFTTFEDRTYSSYTKASECALKWLSALEGVNSDSAVITVGAFKEFMRFMFSNIFPNMETKSEESNVSYSAWKLNIETDTSAFSGARGTHYLTVSATRNKYTTEGTDSSGNPVISTETETADLDQISVVMDDGNSSEYCVITNPTNSSSEGKWEITFSDFASDKKEQRSASVRVYVDRLLESEISEGVTYTQNSYVEDIVKTEYSMVNFDTIASVSAKENTQKVYFLVKVVETYKSGTTKTTYLDADVLTIVNRSFMNTDEGWVDSDAEATFENVSPGIYQVTFPENTSTEYSRTFECDVTCGDLEPTYYITQSPASDGVSDDLYGIETLFAANETLLDNISASGEQRSVAIYSSEYEILKDSADTVSVSTLDFTLKSKPDWATVSFNTNNQILDITVQENTTSLARTGEIVFYQPKSDKELVIALSQKENVVVESENWDVYAINMDTSAVSLDGETRDYEVIFRKSIRYSNGVINNSYYSGKDVNVEVSTIEGDGVASVAYESTGWKITFPKSTTANTYRVTASYQNVNSAIRTVYQGDDRVKTDYIFKINNVYFGEQSAGNSYNSTLQTITYPQNSGTIDIYISSYTIDYYKNGSAVLNAFDFIPIDSWTFTNDDPFTKVSVNSGVMTIKLPENTSSQRTDNIKVTQGLSGNTFSFNITQEEGTQEYFIKIADTNYSNNDNKDIEINSSGNSSVKYYVKPIKIINGTETVMPYTDLNIHENLNWVTADYDTSTGILTLVTTENTSGSKRSGTIFIDYYGQQLTSTITLTQTAGASYIKIEGTTGDVLYEVKKTKEAQTITVNVESNYAYTISGSTPWATILNGITKSAGSSTITFDLAKNNFSSNRSYDFKLIGEGGTTRILRLTQTARTNYIDVLEFENSDLLVCTSSWKNKICIPIVAGQEFFIDYYSSDVFNVGLSDSDDIDSFAFSTDASNFTSSNYKSCNLYISPKNSTLSTSGTISLSYYDSSLGQIICGRKIHVYNLPNANVLPYGRIDSFNAGLDQNVEISAYVKPGVTKVSSYCKSDSATSLEKSTVECEENTTDLVYVPVALPANKESKYRDFYVTLYSEVAGDTDTTAEVMPEFRIHQLPYRALKCYYNTPGTQNIAIPATTAVNLQLKCSELYSCSGHWEVYNDSIPSWISILNPVSSSGTIVIRVEVNPKASKRTATLKFWCDSDYDTINTFTITQQAAPTKVSSSVEYDYSLVTASTTSNYMYLTGVTKAVVKKTFNTDGAIENSNTITTSISTTNGVTKIDYSIGKENTYYDKDIYKVITLTCADGAQRELFIKNPRTANINVSIEQSALSYDSDTVYRGVSKQIAITSNIGLTGFYQSTYYPIEKGTADFSTSEVSTKANGTKYVDSFFNPEKMFYKPQVMDKMIYWNMDLLSGFYSYEDNLLLDAGTNYGGIELLSSTGSKWSDISSSGGESTFSVSLPSNTLDSADNKTYVKLYYRSYDGVTVSTTQSGSGFSVSYDQSECVKKVGSLGYVCLSIMSNTDNTGSDSKYLGIITLSLSNGTKKSIWVYQAANEVKLVGKNSLYSVDTSTLDSYGKWNESKAYLIYKKTSDSWDITFLHQYPNWMFINLLSNSTTCLFNGKAYSGTFGSGGNCGTATSALSLAIDDCKYRSVVALTPPSAGFTVDPNSLEIKELGKYGLISTYSSSNITDPANVKSILHVYSRPVFPKVTIANSSKHLIIDSDGNTKDPSDDGTTSIAWVLSLNKQTVSSTKVKYTLNFSLTSNYVDLCTNYVGKTIKMNGKEITIETEFDLFLKLIKELKVNYILSTGTSGSFNIPASSYTKTDGSYLIYNASTTVSSQELIKSANLVVTLDDFIVDPAIYVDSPTYSISALAPLIV